MQLEHFVNFQNSNPNLAMTINSKQLHFILDNTPPEQNIMLVGKHGIGKSRILEDYFSKRGAKVITLFLGQMSDPGDLIGLPEKNVETGKTDFMLPYWFPVDGNPIVLFLDELNRARPEVLQTIMDLTLNRKLAGKTLPPGSRIISAVNGGSEYQLTDLDPALVSRFNIYEFSPTVSDWLDWARENKIDSRIINFIEKNPECLDETSLTQSENNLERTADRRSFERASNILTKIPQTDFSANIENISFLLSGILGVKTTSLFMRFVKENNFLSASDILLSNDFFQTEENLKRFENFSIPDFTKLNKSLFIFIENFLNQNENSNFEKSKSLSLNLKNYFDFLEKSNRKEIQSHFVSLCSAKDFPKTLCFITDFCGDLYQKMFDSLSV